MIIQQQSTPQPDAQSGESTIDAADVARFSALANEWWDEQGPFKPLHRMTPLRISYLRDTCCDYFLKDSDAPQPLHGLRVLDIGCGGGLVSEPLSRLGADMMGIDASAENIAIAQTHALQNGLDVNYRTMTAEALAQKGAQYDVVLALEIIEHVSDVALFMNALAQLVRPGGLVFISTLNRTFKSYALAIVGAEYILRWLPRGTHDWQQFMRPSEIIIPMQQRGLLRHDLCGMVYNPLRATWRLDSNDVTVNYILAMQKPETAI